MTTKQVFVPVLIETAEQADALPDGTVAIRDGHWPRILLRDDTGQHWASGGHGSFMYPPDMTGWTALVPVEAEEETHSVQTRGQKCLAWRTRLVTPWEPA